MTFNIHQEYYFNLTSYFATTIKKILLHKIAFIVILVIID